MRATAAGSAVSLNDLPLAERLAVSLSNNTHDCMVCMERVNRRQPVWSCRSCFQVLHLRCIKEWASKSAASSFEWRCPACQSLSSEFPKHYLCFCGKMRDPPLDTRSNNVPHSCGELCMRPLLHPRTREPCGHACADPCHPGPCAPCNRLIDQECFCRQAHRKVTCSSSLRYSCGSICNRTLNCGVHQCQSVCHDGPCTPCAVEVEQRCYCGTTVRTAICGTGQPDTAHSDEPRFFSCRGPCGLDLDCENHTVRPEEKKKKNKKDKEEERMEK
jgi:transcriptional repressor NF-X1